MAILLLSVKGIAICLVKLQGDGHSPPQCEGAGHLPLKVKGAAIPLLQFTWDGNSPPQCAGDGHAPLHKGRGRVPSLQVQGMAIILLNGKGYDAHLHLNAKGMFTFLFKVKGLLILLSIGDGHHSFQWGRHDGHFPVNAKGVSTFVIRARCPCCLQRVDRYQIVLCLLRDHCR